MPRHIPEQERIRRANCMLALYRQGSTLHEIGQRYGLTRERVRQILTEKFGVQRLVGGAHLRGELRESVTNAERERRYLTKYGCGYADWKVLSRTGVTTAYKYQRRSAKTRGIEYHLTLADFWKIWKDSGKWEFMGRGRGRYCLTRVNDKGPYAVGNVVVMTTEQNGRLYAASKRGKAMRPKEQQGVCLLYPGWRKPYIAYYRRVRIGYFATEAEAYAARHAHMQTVAA